MVYFKYLPNILKHSASMAVSMKILKTTQQMYSHWFLPVFKVVMMILVWRHYNYDNYKLKICALLISFQSGTATEKKKERKKVLLTEFSQIVSLSHLYEDIKILCMHYKNTSQIVYQSKELERNSAVFSEVMYL